eukprot:CAMPEP_0182430316 /NCGR_PEP_ID=MMETSP1167-20130531/39341_1 /TAXON_ID=2988 /ORGANISM="Mallomonas Sp, Strain CCMP3275" /LENGTH=75 /DNA_ID=CAMNT_0024615261 /DNA_START=66 /DNA_END=293 /DNA_ORIENTATION=-
MTLGNERQVERLAERNIAGMMLFNGECAYSYTNELKKCLSSLLGEKGCTNAVRDLVIARGMIQYWACSDLEREFC